MRAVAMVSYGGKTNCLPLGLALINIAVETNHPLSRYGYPAVRLFWMVGLQMVRSLQACVLLSPGRAVFHIAMAVGRIAGYVYPAGKER